MAIKRMLIDSSHAEETRVVVATGTRLDEFDFETSTRKQLKGNIYLAKVIRVEPSLQAAFVEYGGNRHGFLPFSEIHPDYYQIPLADREALFREQEAAAEQAEANEDAEAERAKAASAGDFAPEPAPENDTEGSAYDVPAPEDVGIPELSPLDASTDSWEAPAARPASDEDGADPDSWSNLDAAPPPLLARAPEDDDLGVPEFEPPLPLEGEPAEGLLPPTEAQGFDEPIEAQPAYPSDQAEPAQPPSSQETGPRENGHGGIEEVGGDEIDDAERKRAHVSRSLLSRRYKIQEVIKKRQIMLVQVVKEERGTKGAALTTYLSLAGRYCVLMPNAIRGGGISRKIVNAEDRRRLKSITSELEVPGRMGLIVRTAGMNRTKAEIKRDFEYLIRQWESIRDLTLQSSAPCLIYGEADLIRRSIRDLYTKEIEEILVEGEEGYRVAKDFMRTLIPSHTAKVQPYRDRVPLFVRHQIESQLDSMYSPQVQLRSGGYMVMNQTEALVAIDVNSGRATKERNIEETAYRTNMEAADEVARQLRLRDLAGLIVIDFIDMNESRNQRTVERRLKEALKSDRARIQVGRISAFGLLEMSRQRLRPSLAEASMESCTACGGTGMLRSTESAALHVLRAIEEEGMRDRASEIRVRVPSRVAMYVLNHKRHALAAIEARYTFLTSFAEDNTLVPPGIEIERVRARGEGPPPELRTIHAVTPDLTPMPPIEDDIPIEDESPETEISEDREPEAAGAETEGQREHSRRWRRKRGHGFEGREHAGPRHDEYRPERPAATEAEPFEAPERQADDLGPGDEAEPLDRNNAAPAVPGSEEEAQATRRRRRGRRGGRRRQGRGGVVPQAESEPGAVQPVEDRGEPIAVNVSEVAATGEAAQPQRDRPRRRRRRGRRGNGEGTEGGEHRRPIDSGTANGPSHVPEQPTYATEKRIESGRQFEPPHDEAPMAHATHNVETPRRSTSDEMEDSAPSRTSNRPSDDEPPPSEGPSGSSRRGWWQRVLNGR